jgi:microcystin-dependent protein
VGWALCQGQLIPITENETLFTLIGTTYGGDGVSTFALPNLASRIPYHLGNGYTIGQPGGLEQVTLTTQQIPAHTHSAMANTPNGNQSAPAGNVWGAGTLSGYTADQTANTTMNPAALSSSGGSQPHDNMPPFLCLNFIISLFGVFPSQT